MKTKQVHSEFGLMREVEVSIEQRLGRSVLLDTLSIIELEQLTSLLKEQGESSDKQLAMALNEMLDTQ